MTDASILRQKQRERQKWLRRAEERERLEREQAAREQQRLAALKNQWASICTARANAMLSGFQHAQYQAKAQRLLGLLNDE